MKTTIALAALCAVGFASCDNGANTTTATTTDTVATAPAADPNMITTTTTTTTTRPAFQPRQGVQYMDLRTKKLVTVRVDTVHHYVVNAQTNQPLDFFIEPGSTDTFYGRNMQVANGYINYGSGSDWTYDESRANSSANTSTMDNSNMSSTTTDNSMSSGSSGSDVKKIKTNGKETKVKTTDGGKMKTNDNETKIKK